MRRRAFDRRSFLALGHLLVAVGVTAPLAWHLDRLPLGREPSPTVPRFNLWTLEWTADRLPHGLAGWWNAPIFWPDRGTFAWSEVQPLTGLAHAALRPLVGATASYGLLLIFAIGLNGIAGAALARRLGADVVPAFLVGVLVQALPFVVGQLGVLQLVAAWPMLLVLAFVIDLLGRPSLGVGLRLGLALAAVVGTCGYYALLLGLCLLPPTVAVWWRRPADRRRPVGAAATAAVVAVLLVGPVAIGQEERLAGRRWSAATIEAGSASWADWLPGGTRWPGWPLVALGVAGALTARRRPTTRLLVGLGTIALLASLGSRLSIIGVRPWTLLVDHVDAVARLRSPFRAAVLVELSLAGLAVPALAWLWDRRSVLRAAAPAAVALTLVAGPPLGAGSLDRPIPRAGAWATWLADHPDGGAVAFVPFAPGRRTADFAPTTARMLQNLRTGHPMVNGYSGFFPRDHASRRAALVGFPSDRSVAELDRLGVRYVLVDADRFDRIDREVATDLGLAILVENRDAVLLEVPPS